MVERKRLKLLDQRNTPNCSGYRIEVQHGDNVNNVRRETNRYFMNKKKEYLKVKIMRLQQTIRKEHQRSV
jgi:UDP-2,3-diacylglucosamine pyrophosphatase LpxH